MSDSYTLEASAQKFIEKYNENRTFYVNLASSVEKLLTVIIEEKKLPYHRITSRAKEAQSLLEKIKRKRYQHPQEEVRDLAGIRIITTLENEVAPICKIIEDNFEIDHDNSSDRSDELGTNMLGYKSYHYVAKFDSYRLKLIEYSKYENVYFEIQIRTMLQHVWAEISHGRSYKSNFIKDPAIERRLNLLSGLLETADQAFCDLVKEINNYSQKVGQNITGGDLDIPVDSISIKEYLLIKFKELFRNGAIDRFYNDVKEADTFSELHRFGIETLKDLDATIPVDFVDKQLETGAAKGAFLNSLLIDIMLIDDYKKYFEKAWRESHWKEINVEREKLYELYNVPVSEIRQKYFRTSKKFHRR